MKSWELWQSEGVTKEVGALRLVRMIELCTEVEEVSLGFFQNVNLASFATLTSECSYHRRASTDFDAVELRSLHLVEIDDVVFRPVGRTSLDSLVELSFSGSVNSLTLADEPFFTPATLPSLRRLALFPDSSVDDWANSFAVTCADELDDIAGQLHHLKLVDWGDDEDFPPFLVKCRNLISLDYNGSLPIFAPGTTLATPLAGLRLQLPSFCKADQAQQQFKIAFELGLLDSRTAILIEHYSHAAFGDGGLNEWAASVGLKLLYRRSEVNSEYRRRGGRGIADGEWGFGDAIEREIAKVEKEAAGRLTVVEHR